MSGDKECLKCGREFCAHSPFNRICPTCTRENENVSGIGVVVMDRTQRNITNNFDDFGRFKFGRLIK